MDTDGLVGGKSARELTVYVQKGGTFVNAWRLVDDAGLPLPDVAGYALSFVHPDESVWTAAVEQVQLDGEAAALPTFVWRESAETTAELEAGSRGLTFVVTSDGEPFHEAIGRMVVQA